MSPQSESPPLSYALTRLSRQIGRGLGDLRAFELSGPHVIALLTLHHDSGLSNAQLARRCLVTPQSMNEVVLELERRDLLTRDPDPSNQRILRAQLTSSGEAMSHQLEERIAALEETLLDGFSEPEARRFRESVAKCVRNLGLPSIGTADSGS